MKIKIFIVIQLMCLIIASTTGFAKYSDVENDALYSEAINSLSDMNIISGYNDGTFGPNNNLTRAELLKMIVLSIGKDNEAKALQNSTIFSDVNETHWATGYINYGIKNNLMTGYSDGTFRPDQEVNFAQGITVMLRALGYNSLDGLWPQNYIQKAKRLEITKGINLEDDKVLTRANAALFIHRMLNTKVNSSDNTLIQVSNIGTIITRTIIDAWDLNNSLPKGTIKTDSGDLFSTSLNGIDYLGKKVSIIVKDNNILSIQNVDLDSKIMFVEDISGNYISYFDKNGTGDIEIAPKTLFYYNDQKYNFEDIRENIWSGSIISLTYVDGKIVNGVLTGPILSGAQVVKSDVKLSDKEIGTIDISDIENIRVIKNGKSSQLTDIKMFDVIYSAQNPFNNSRLIMVYDNKIFGTYDEALPSKSSVSKIILSGKELTIDNSLASDKLNNSLGSFDINEYITVLTGIDGKIVDVISPSSIDLSNIAIVVNTRKGLQTPINQLEEETYYAKIYKADGNTIEYQSDEDYSSLKGNVVRYKVIDNVVSIITVNHEIISGDVNEEDIMIGGNYLAANVKLLDINLEVEDDEDVIVKPLVWGDMPNQIKSDKVIHAERGGDFDDVQLLVVNNLFDEEQYGILIDYTKNEGTSQNPYSATYKIMVGGTPYTYTNSFTSLSKMFIGMAGDVVYVERDDNKLSDMRLLTPIEKSNKIDAIDFRRIKINGKIYKLDENVQIYDISNATPSKLELNEVIYKDINYSAIYISSQTRKVKAITIMNE